MITCLQLGITTIDVREGGSYYNILFKSHFKMCKNIILSDFGGGLFLVWGSTKWEGVLEGVPTMDDLRIFLEEGWYHL